MSCVVLMYWYNVLEPRGLFFLMHMHFHYTNQLKRGFKSEMHVTGSQEVYNLGTFLEIWTF